MYLIKSICVRDFVWAMTKEMGYTWLERRQWYLWMIWYKGNPPMQKLPFLVAELRLPKLL